MMSRASARAIKDLHDRYAAYANRGGWNLPTDDKQQSTVHVSDQTRDQVQRPSTGRNTKLGRRVEKPQDPSAGGPSGQKEIAKHNKKHTNK